MVGNGFCLGVKDESALPHVQYATGLGALEGVGEGGGGWEGRDKGRENGYLMSQWIQTK